jgi:hypothetical protein
VRPRRAVTPRGVWPKRRSCTRVLRHPGEPMRLLLILTLASCLGLASSVAAQGDITQSTSGYTYFYKAGANWDDHVDDVQQCSMAADRMTPLILSAYSSGAHGVLGSALESGFHSMHKRRTMAANIENCMVVRQWAVVRLDPVIGAEIMALPNATKAERLRDMVGADRAAGEIVRRFSNEAADNRTRMFSDPGDLDKPSLSVEAVRSVPLAPTKAVPADVPDRVVKPKRPVQSTKLEQVTRIPDGYAVVLIGLADPQRKANNLRFLRAPNPDGSADSLPDEFVAAIGGAIWNRPKEKLEAFVVPSGRWRLTHRSDGIETVSFCLGAPAFEVAAGEIVYIGRYDVSGSGAFGPHAGWSPSPADITKFPRLGEGWRSAEVVGHDETVCWGSFLYALR